MSTYSSNLKIELIATGDQSGVWGTTTNSNFSNVFEQSIVGRVTVSFSNADVTLTATNTVASQDYRNVYLNCTGTNAASRNLIVPTLNKNYIVENNTTGGFSIVVKTSAGTGITIPNGFKCAVYVNGTDVVQNDNYFPAAVFASITDSGLTSGRVVYSTTAGLLTDSANLLYSGTDLTVYGLTVGRGLAGVSTNTAVGASALTTNTTGSLNTALGFEALKLNTSGAENVAVGYRALDANTIGTNNIAMGRNALGANISGSANVAVGDGALVTNTTADSNSAFGSDALSTNSTGANNVAIGRSALNSNTTASNNTAVGYQAGYSNATGTGETYLGYQAGYLNTGNYNTFVGVTAGYAATTGTLNSFFGYGSGSVVTTGSKNSILGGYNGNQGGLDIRTASNNIVLSDGDGDPRYVLYKAGAVSTTAVDIAPSNVGTGGLHFVSCFNTADGSQGWFLIATRVNSVTTISSSNNTGLTITFGQTSSVRLNVVTSSGTINVTCTTIS